MSTPPAGPPSPATPSGAAPAADLPPAELDELARTAAADVAGLQRLICSSLEELDGKARFRFDRWQRRILRLVKNSNGLIRIRHLDYSTPDRNGARWPIYLLEIGRPGALKKHAVTLVSGVHGLETIGIRIHLDILKSLINPKSKFYSPDLQAGKFGIYSIPIMNPAGVARLTRANARGIDLNRNHSFKYGGAGTSTSACNLTYRGPAAISEPETQALQSYMSSIFTDQRGPGDSDPAPADTTGAHHLGRRHPIPAVALRARPSDVRTVIINGRTVFDDHQFLDLDEAQIIAEADLTLASM